MTLLTDFLLARYEEERTELRYMIRRYYKPGEGPDHALTDRLDREIQAKRRIVEWCREVDAEPNPPEALQLSDRVKVNLASPYADHPEYREEWRP